MQGTTAKSQDEAHAPGQGADSGTIQWNESAAIAARRMRLGVATALTVMADGLAIGEVRLDDIESAERNGNWLGAVMAHHLMRRREDTCN